MTTYYVEPTHRDALLDVLENVAPGDVVYVAPGVYNIFKPEKTAFHGCILENPVKQLQNVQLIGDPHCEIFTDYEPGEVVLTSIFPGEQRDPEYAHTLYDYFMGAYEFGYWVMPLTDSFVKGISFDFSGAPIRVHGNCTFEDCNFRGIRKPGAPYNAQEIVFKRCTFLTPMGKNIRKPVNDGLALTFVGCVFKGVATQFEFNDYNAAFRFIGCQFSDVRMGGGSGGTVLGVFMNNKTGLNPHLEILASVFQDVGMAIYASGWHYRDSDPPCPVRITAKDSYFNRVMTVLHLDYATPENLVFQNNRYNMILSQNTQDFEAGAAIGPAETPPVGWGRVELDGVKHLYLAVPVSVRRSIPVPCTPGTPTYVTLTVQKNSTGWDAAVYFGKSKAVLEDTLAPQTFELSASVSVPKVVPLEFICDADAYDTSRGLIVRQIKIVS